MALNLIRPESDTRPGIFKTPSLNRIIIFKYPNFHTPSGTQPAAASVIGSPAVLDQTSDYRPIETGIYVPYDAAQVELGGHGIYLRQRNYNELLQRFLGIDAGAKSGDVARDLSVLSLIDEIPSLDPFLMRQSLCSAYSDIDEQLFEIGQAEFAAIKQIITSKLTPIIARALEGTGRAGRIDQTQKFIDSLWDPKFTDASLFVQAFGIQAESAPQILHALKGISFYEWVISRQSRMVADFLIWLRSKDSRPFDLHRNGMEADAHLMFRDSLGKRLQSTCQDAGRVFRMHNDSHKSFLSESNPKPYRDFLGEVTRYFWMLGHCATAMSNICYLFGDQKDLLMKGKLPMAETNELLKLVGIALDKRSGGLN